MLTCAREVSQAGIIFHLSFGISHCRASDEVSTESGSDRVSINPTLKIARLRPGRYCSRY